MPLFVEPPGTGRFARFQRGYAAGSVRDRGTAERDATA